LNIMYFSADAAIIGEMIGLVSLSLVLAAEESRSTRVRPLEPMASWFSDMDYPVDAMLRDAQGLVRFRLWVDESGHPRDCKILQSSNDPSLDAATCSILLARGRFEPAHDSAGRPVVDTITSRVRWALPDEAQSWMPFIPVRVVSMLHATAAGEIECSIGTSGPLVRAPASEECGFFAGSGIGARMRASRVDAAATFIFTSVPRAGSLPPVAEADYGALIYEGSAQMSIAPSGYVTDCRVIRNHVALTTADIATPTDICAARPPVPGPAYAPAPGSTEFRSARVTVSIYFRAAAQP
jgi:TonB family protein